MFLPRLPINTIFLKNRFLFVQKQWPLSRLHRNKGSEADVVETWPHCPCQWGSFFFSSFTFNYMSLYVREYVEPAQKEGSLRTGARLLILDGEIITAFNMQNQKKKQKQNKTLISL